MTHDNDLGPDLVLAGAARSGTSTLAARLGKHPGVDPGKVKEPNYFSRRLDEGPEWYDRLFEPRRPGLLRLDASVSYTSPLHPEALGVLAAASPQAFVVYTVRDPTLRAVSHYQFRHHHFQLEPAPDFGSALRAGSYYVDGSDYQRWLSELDATFPRERQLIVPFEVVTEDVDGATAVVWQQLGLDPGLVSADESQVHRNAVVEYRHALFGRAVGAVRHSGLYPVLRSAVGASRLRRLRDLATRKPSLPSHDEVMASCGPDELEQLRDLETRAGAAVRHRLAEQDTRLGLSWLERSFAAHDN